MVFLASLALFCGSYLYLIPEFKSLAFPLFAVGLAGFVSICCWESLKNEAFYISASAVSVITGLFWIMGLFAGYHAGDAEVAIGATFVALLYFATRRIMRERKATASALKAYLLCTGIVLAWSLAVSLPTLGESYQGVFENPNAMGGVLATFAAVLVAMLLAGKWRMMKMMALVIVVALVALTRSRGALASTLVCIATMLAIWVPVILRSSDARRGVAWFMIAGPIAVVALWNPVVNPVLSKIAYKEYVVGDISDGRFSLWAQYLSESTLAGRGREILFEYDLAPHNTFVSIIAQYGWIAGLLFFALVLMMGYTSWKKRVIGKAPNYLPLFSCLSFLTLSMTEGMMLKSTMVAMFLFYPADLRVHRLVNARLVPKKVHGGEGHVDKA